MNFDTFRKAVAAKFAEMQKERTLFVSSVDRNTLWNTYLSSFPEGSNPIYRESTWHDCACCRSFIKGVGNVVAIDENLNMTTIWDIDIPSEPEYQIVANELAKAVKMLPIDTEFVYFQRTAGTDVNYEEVDGKVITYEHFFANIKDSFVETNSAERNRSKSDFRASHDVFKRGLEELTLESFDEVIDLIGQDSLYRGPQYLEAVKAFRRFKVTFDSLLSEEKKELFVWKNCDSPAARLRNNAMGTLLVDLSEGVELNKALKSYDTIMAPENYKRTTAPVTKVMVENAENKINELGLASALNRRYATLSDISVNDILFADRDARKSMSQGKNVFADIVDSIADKKPKIDKVEEVHIEKFIKDVLPTATSIELMVENRLSNNLVSLVAPSDPTAGKLFSWNNGFSWAYNGDVTDSIKERVKNAGGNVSGDLCCRLAWFNHDDLDLHMKEPDGCHIYFQTYAQKRTNRKSSSGGVLDVDMNAGGGQTREPVENIFYSSERTMKEGVYTLFVNQFQRRESNDTGFEVEIDFKGTIHKFSYPNSLSSGQNVVVAKFKYSLKNGIEFIESLPSTTVSKDVWNISTEKYHKVNLMLLSPNFWDGQENGNKHYFFMIDDCKNPDAARGFFNEYLRGDLKEHRKVFEIVGSKMKALYSDDQLSGLGFSSTLRNYVLCKVTSSFSRVIKIVF